MAADGSSNGGEVARLREMAEQYRKLAANITDPATVSAMRQMANDYDADADELEAHSPKLPKPTTVQSPAVGAVGNTGSGCPLERLLRRPPIEGAVVPLVLAGVVVPTVLRASVWGFVPGNEFLAYVPFVFLAALLLKPWSAASVAGGSALTADFFFMEPHFRLAAATSDLFGMGVFLICCGMTICLVRAFRLMLSTPTGVQVVPA